MTLLEVNNKGVSTQVSRYTNTGLEERGNTGKAQKVSAFPVLNRYAMRGSKAPTYTVDGHE